MTGRLCVYPYSMKTNQAEAIIDSRRNDWKIEEFLGPGSRARTRNVQTNLLFASRPPRPAARPRTPSPPPDFDDDPPTPPPEEDDDDLRREAEEAERQRLREEAERRRRAEEAAEAERRRKAEEAAEAERRRRAEEAAEAIRQARATVRPLVDDMLKAAQTLSGRIIKGEAIQPRTGKQSAGPEAGEIGDSLRELTRGWANVRNRREAVERIVPEDLRERVFDPSQQAAYDLAGRMMTQAEELIEALTDRLDQINREPGSPPPTPPPTPPATPPPPPSSTDTSGDFSTPSSTAPTTPVGPVGPGGDPLLSPFSPGEMEKEVDDAERFLRQRAGNIPQPELEE